MVRQIFSEFMIEALSLFSLAVLQVLSQAMGEGERHEVRYGDSLSSR